MIHLEQGIGVLEEDDPEVKADSSEMALNRVITSCRSDREAQAIGQHIRKGIKATASWAAQLRTRNVGRTVASWCQQLVISSLYSFLCSLSFSCSASSGNSGLN